MDEMTEKQEEATRIIEAIGTTTLNECYVPVTNRCSNFQQVLVNGDDQVLVRELLKEHVPIEIQIKITQLFNQEFARRQVIRNGW